MTSTNTIPKCRVCICALGATDLFYDMLQLPMLAHKFISCTELSVSKEEQVPSELCQVCYEQLEQLYAFRAKCIAADAQWRMNLSACNDEKPMSNLEMPQDQDPPVVELLELELCSEKSIRKRCTRQQNKEAIEQPLETEATTEDSILTEEKVSKLQENYRINVINIDFIDFVVHASHV